MPSTVVAARVDQDTYDHLAHEAERRGITRGALVREAIAKVLAEDESGDK